jgi:hypothetical protein
METIIENEINTEHKQDVEDINDYNYNYDDDDDGINNYQSKTYLTYDEHTEINDEISMMNYHANKDSGDWLSAKYIISQQTDTRTEFLWDYLESRFKLNNDDFDNIKQIFYKDTFLNSICEFSETIAKYVVDNLKIKKFVPKGYIFSTSDKLNEWNFTITVITTKGIYSANRYVDETMIGWY